MGAWPLVCQGILFPLFEAIIGAIEVFGNPDLVETYVMPEIGISFTNATPEPSALFWFWFIKRFYLEIARDNFM